MNLRKISHKFTLPVLLITMLMGVGIYFLLTGTVDKMLSANFEKRIKIKFDELFEKVKAEGENNIAIASLFAGNSTARNAYVIAYRGNTASESSQSLQNARDYLRRELSGVLESYQKGAGKKLKLHFHVYPARSLVRLWRNKQLRRDGKWVDVSDDISSFRQSVEMITSGKKPKIGGIEVGDSGFSIRGICPIKSNEGKIMGSVEVISSFDDVFRNIKLSSHQSFSVFINVDLLNIAKSLKNTLKYPVISGKHVLVSATNSELSLKLISGDDIENAENRNYTKNIGSHIISFLSIKDVFGKKIGIVAYALNIEKENASLTMMKIRFLIGIIIVSFLNFFIIFFLVNRRIVKPIKTLSSIIVENSKGDLTVKYPLPKKNCSKILGCGKTDCVEYGQDEVLCFLVVGSDAKEFGREMSCPSLLNGTYKTCEECVIYKGIIKDELHLIGAWYNTLIISIAEVIGGIKERGKVIYNQISSLSSAFEETSATIEEFTSNTKNVDESTKAQAEMVDEAMGSVTQINEHINLITSSVEKQSSSLEDFSSTIEELTANIRSIASVSDNANKVSRELSEVAQQGGEVIEGVINAVSGMEENTKQISEILGVITGIAEQTNLLAMNAAIEAAHAGEYGKGFAVVADEIRTLAENSSTSSKEIQKLIKNIVLSVKNAAQLGDNAEKSLVKITGDVKNSRDINSEIFSSTQQQANGVNEIIKSINSILEEMNDIKSRMDSIRKDSRRILNSVYNIKTLSLGVSQSSDEQTKGSQQILDSILEENNAIEQIKQITDEFYVLIERFITDKKRPEPEVAVVEYEEY